MIQEPRSNCQGNLLRADQGRSQNAVLKESFQAG